MLPLGNYQEEEEDEEEEFSKCPSVQYSKREDVPLLRGRESKTQMIQINIWHQCTSSKKLSINFKFDLASHNRNQSILYGTSSSKPIA